MSPAENPRAVSRAVRALLYATIAATFGAGTQLVILAEHTDRYFAWSVAVPMSAVFIGASFWAASVILVWAARQTLWVRVRVPVLLTAGVAILLLIATVQHIEQFDSLLGFLWIEIYAVTPPIAAAIVVMQLMVPGRDPAPAERLPSGLRLALGFHAAALLGFGAFLYFAPGHANDIWPWQLTDLTSMAIGTWMLGIGTLAAYVAARNDRDDVPGASLAYLLLSGMLGLGLARFPGDVDFASADTWVFIAFLISAAAIGAYGAMISLREGRFASAMTPGGVPVQMVRRGS